MELGPQPMNQSDVFELPWPPPSRTLAAFCALLVFSVTLVGIWREAHELGRVHDRVAVDERLRDRLRHAFEEGHVFGLPELLRVAGVARQHKIDLAHVLQHADADTRLGGRALAGGDTHVVLAPDARGERRAEDKQVAGALVGHDHRRVFVHLIGLGQHFRDRRNVAGRVLSIGNVDDGRPGACRHDSISYDFAPAGLFA